VPAHFQAEYKEFAVLGLEQLVNESLARHGVQVEQPGMTEAELAYPVLQVLWRDAISELVPPPGISKIARPAPLPSGF
jgi:hypothetical protein